MSYSSLTKQSGVLRGLAATIEDSDNLFGCIVISSSLQGAHWTISGARCRHNTAIPQAMSVGATSSHSSWTLNILKLRCDCMSSFVNICP